MFEPTRTKRITSHADLTDTGKVTKRLAAIPSPYTYSDIWTVYRDAEGRLVFIVETAHKRDDVFELAPGVGARRCRK